MIKAYENYIARLASTALHEQLTEEGQGVLQAYNKVITLKRELAKQQAMQGKIDRLEGINVQMAEEIAGLEAELKQGHTCNTCLRDQLKNGEHPCEPLDECKYGKKWDDLKAELTLHQWIPVGVRLPEEEGWYYVWYGNYKPQSPSHFRWDGKWMIATKFHTTRDIKAITHWRPISLPSPATDVEVE
jgi:hypothetical protein